MFPGFLSVFLRTLGGFLSFCRSVRLSAFCLKRREKGNMESLKGKVIGHILCSCCHAVVLDQIATSPKGMKWKAVKRDNYAKAGRYTVCTDCKKLYDEDQYAFFDKFYSNMYE